jgi:hypothetical protein
MSGWFLRWVHSPMGPKTTHFWAPTANSFFPLQGLYDWNRDPAIISKEMQFILMCILGIYIYRLLGNVHKVCLAYHSSLHDPLLRPHEQHASPRQTLLCKIVLGD